MESILVTLLTGGFGLYLAIVWFVGLAWFLFWPICAWIAVRHLRGIRRELARLNESGGAGGYGLASATGGADATDRAPRADGSQWTRTSPLTIR